jgi:putative tryptophan/tyrosine transport system substrate-binding protein
VIGLLGSESPDWYTGRLRAFREGLGETGYIEGRNVTIDYRWAEGRNDACRRSRPNSCGNRWR